MDFCREIIRDDIVKCGGFPVSRSELCLPLTTHKSCYTITGLKPSEPNTISWGRECTSSHWTIPTQVLVASNYYWFSYPITDFSNISQLSTLIFSYESLICLSTFFLQRFLNGGEYRKAWQKGRFYVGATRRPIGEPGFPDPGGQCGYLICTVGVADNGG